MTKPGDNAGDNGGGGGVVAVKCPYLTITFDPRTYLCTVSGSVPHWRFAKYMLEMALEETEEHIAAAKNDKRIAIPGGPLISIDGRG